MMNKKYTQELLRIKGKNNCDSLFGDWNTSTVGVPKETDNFPEIVVK